MSIPKGWAISEIGSVTRVVAGGTPPSKTPANFQALDGVPWITPADLSGYKSMYISSGARNLSEHGYAICSAVKVPEGTVLFSSRAPIGYVAIAENEISTNQGFKNFVLPRDLESRFVYYYLRHIKPLAERMATGTTFKELSGQAAAKLPLLIAPIAEQQRIANKLATVLARVDSCKNKIVNVSLLIKRFRQSVLTSATSGRLTATWRLKQSVKEDAKSVYEYLEKNLEKLQEKLRGKRIEEIIVLYNRISYNSDSLPDGWANCPVGMIGMVSNGSTPLRAERNFWEGHIPWVSSGEVKNCIIHKSNECISELGFQSTSVRILPVGSVLIAMIGEGKTRGQSAILEIEATINQNIAAVVPFADGLISKYLWYSFQEKYEENRREGNGTGPQALNCQRVRELTLNLPPLAEQHEIVKRIEALFSFADRLEARLATACTAVDRLTPALLAKAFRGELVPQDSADEPASELLARLAASRAAETAKPRRTRAAKA